MSTQGVIGNERPATLATRPSRPNSHVHTHSRRQTGDIAPPTHTDITLTHDIAPLTPEHTRSGRSVAPHTLTISLALARAKRGSRKCARSVPAREVAAATMVDVLIVAAASRPRILLGGKRCTEGHTLRTHTCAGKGYGGPQRAVACHRDSRARWFPHTPCSHMHRPGRLPGSPQTLAACAESQLQGTGGGGGTCATPMQRALARGYCASAGCRAG